MLHQGPSSSSASWIHPSPPSQHQKQGDRRLDPMTQPMPCFGKPKCRLFPSFTWWSKKKASGPDKTQGNDDDIRTVTGLKEFSNDHLVRATGNFSSAKKLGEGPFGRTLHEHLFGDTGGRTIPWQARYKVALSLASALCHLHHDLKERCVLHKNINSHAVLLDEEFNMKLDVFGFTGQTDAAIPSVTSAAADTQSYIAPDHCEVGEHTAASDVYSFGAVALELASGRDSSQYASTLGHRFLMQWVWRCYAYEILLEACDEKLMGNFDRREMEQLMVVGLWCTHSDPAQRPPMDKVLRVLQFQEVSPVPIPPDCRVLQLQEVSPVPVPVPVPADCRVPDPNCNLSLTTSLSFSRSPSVSSACDSDLDDCLR